MSHLLHVLAWLHHLHAQQSWATFTQHCGAISDNWNGSPRGCQ